MKSTAPDHTYFRTLPHKPHDSSCTAENTNFNKSSIGINNNYEQVNSQKELLTFKQLDRSTMVNNNVEIPSNTISDSIKSERSVSESKESYDSRKLNSYSLHRIYIEIQKAISNSRKWKDIRVNMNWPHINKNGKISQFFPGINKSSIPFSSFVLNTNDSNIRTSKEDYIFWGQVTITQKKTKYGDEFFFEFPNNKFTPHWTSKRLKGIHNIQKLKDAVVSKKPIEILLCGHFYEKDGKIIFISRTPYVTDFISIID